VSTVLETALNEPRVVEVNGVAVHAFDSACALAESVVRSRDCVLPGVAIAINPEKIMRSRKDSKLLAILQEATIRFADGAGVVWAMRRKGVPGNRVPGVDVWEHLMVRCAACEIPIFLLGATPDVLQRTTAKLRQELPEIIIQEALHGYSSDEEIESFSQALSGADRAVVAVAMGSPKQEELIRSLRLRSKNAFFIGVGGTFDCYVGEVQRAPRAWQNANLEWLYRLIRQPSRITRQWTLIPYAVLTLLGRI
jgi:UDP-N-acetyl-D-mannosaminouronate:lipid I N-acetyl-D-mannosaminouronosyltransferase